MNTNVIQGITGNIAFNEEGDRIESLYEIINIQQGQMKVVGTYRTNTVSKTFNVNSIIDLSSRVLVIKVLCVDKM